METYNVRQAKTHLSRLIEKVAQGETFLIAKSGKPVAKLTALDAPVRPPRLGFMEGQISVPDDFNRMGSEEIESLFSGKR